MQVLEAAYHGKFEAASLRFGEAISNRVDKAGCHYYALDVSQQHIDQGFVIGAHSVAGSKFKLLMFETTTEGQWELQLQEDSIKASLTIVQHHTMGLAQIAVVNICQAPKMTVICICFAALS